MTLPQVLLTKIIPPQIPPRTLIRTRVRQALRESLQYRLTLLHAGAGYGKSTALAALAADHQPLVWYQVSREDSDSLVFLLHLCHATRRALPDISGLPIPLLESWDASRGPLPSRDIIYQYLNALSQGLPAPTILVLDDVHLIAENPEIAHILDHLIGLAPQHLHIILSYRPVLKLPNLNRWRARGEVLDLPQAILNFNQEEIAELFSQHYEYELTREEVEYLSMTTEGWAITLQLIWQNLRSGGMASIEMVLSRQDAPLESLFEMLARDVLAKQSADVQQFLRITATLHTMTPDACDALLEVLEPQAPIDSRTMLAYLRRQDLFVVEMGSPGSQDTRLRYHNIFHRFLRQQSTEAERSAWHIRAAVFYQSQRDLDSAIYHLLKANQLAEAARLLAAYGDELLSMGRLDTLAGRLDALPPGTLYEHPTLLFFLGDLARLHSRFQEALGWYQQAESLWRERAQPEGIGRALRGQARVYLDTVDPSRAEDLLQQSLRLSDGTADREAQARLYELLAENKLNSGKPEEAETLRQQAESLRREGPSDSQLLYRVLLRTGRLSTAREKLEARLESERVDPVQTPRAHRETHFLLSLIYAFQGDAGAAYRTAVEGTQRGISLGSPYVTAVGHMRQGHALMLLPGKERYGEARAHFEKAVEISRTLAVPRLRVEAFWGLCRAYGFQGNLGDARDVAMRGIRIAAQAGDEWIGSLTRLTMGASLTLAGQHELAEEWLTRARRGFDECSDPHGATAARLWQCLNWFRNQDMERLAQSLPETLANAHQARYDFLFTQKTLLGVPDERMLVPLLIFARQNGWESSYVDHLLSTLNLADISLHPGYQLKVQTMGIFQVSLGDLPVPQNGWRRATTRQLFQVLLTFRHAPLDREQIFEHIWPNSEPEVAQRNFKVALNTLYKVLEPERKPGSESAYILREGSIYSLRPEADLWLDAEAFSSLIQAAESQLDSNPEAALQQLESALELYKGDYLPDARYESWAAVEREHLAVQFLQSADHLCGLFLRFGRLEECVSLAHRILAEDPCWERAYRHLMHAFARLGDHGQVARTYRRCVQTLEAELLVTPAEETTALYHTLTGNQSP